ncbi:MAG TPA: histidinol-phosphate transaminase [Ignavibacteriaceae bacterium]|nr:histidinol-phosphate transaminase [Ignavibacteriaceae bacterium]
MVKTPVHIKELVPYKAGKPIEELVREKGIKKVVKLASNENPLGPSPKALEVIKDNIYELHRYTDPSNYRLVHEIARRYSKKPDQIICGSGSDSLIQYIIMAFSSCDDELITSQGTFIGWYVNADKLGRKSIIVPLKNYSYDLQKIAEAVTVKTKIVYLANPNNPTGTMFTKKEFEKFMKEIPDSVLVVLDEAYTIYAESNPDYPNGLRYDFENLIVLRTLSKAYGLAGLRLGFAASSPAIIKELYKVKLPFEPNYLAQQAAIAAFEDEKFINKTIETNRKSLELMKTVFNEIGIKSIPTFANFFLLIFPTQEFAFEFSEECLNRGLILRHLPAFGLPDCIRINSGTLDETYFALDVIRTVYPKLFKKYKKFIIDN